MTENTYLAIIGTMILFILGALFTQNRGLRLDLKDLAAEVKRNAEESRKAAKEVIPVVVLEGRFSDITNYVGKVENKVDNHICRNITHVVNGS